MTSKATLPQDANATAGEVADSSPSADGDLRPQQPKPASALQVVVAGVPSAVGSALGFATTLITVLMISALGNHEALIRSHYIPWGLLLAGLVMAHDIPLQIMVAKRGYTFFPVGIVRQIFAFAAVPALGLTVMAMATHWVAPGVFAAILPAAVVSEAGKFFVLMTFAAIPMLLAAMLEAALRGSGRLWIAGVAGILRTAVTIGGVAAAFSLPNPSILWVPLVIATVACVEAAILTRLVDAWTRDNVPSPDVIPGPSYPTLLTAVGIPVFFSYVLLSGTAAAQLQTLRLLPQGADNAVVAMGLYHTWQTFAVVAAVGLATGGSVVMIRANLTPREVALLAVRSLGLAAVTISVAVATTTLVAKRFIPATTPNDTITELLTTNGLTLALVSVATCISVYAITLLEGLAHAKTALLANCVYLTLVVVAGLVAVNSGGGFARFTQVLSAASAIGVVASPILLLWTLRRTPRTAP